MGKTNALSSKSNKTDGKLKKDKFLNLNDAKIDEEQENDADDEHADKTPKTDEERDKVLDLKDDNVGNVIHKKRRRKNVESRDV